MEYQTIINHNNKIYDNENGIIFEILKFLYNNENIYKKIENVDIISKLYELNRLGPKNFLYLFENYSKQLRISSNLIKTLIKKNEINLLNIFFKYSTFYEEETILKFLFIYKNKESYSTTELQNMMSEMGHKIQPNRKGEYLYDTCREGNEFLVKYLIKNSANVNQIFSDGSNPLSAAYINGNKNIIKYLKQNGAKANLDDLFEACYNGNEILVRRLVEYEFDVNQIFSDGSNLLSAAYINGNKNIIKYLKQNGAKANLDDLFEACYNGNEILVRRLVEYEFDVNQRHLNGDTPLIAACYNDNENIVKYLIEQGAILNAIGEENLTPLMIACNEGNEKIMEILLNKGAKTYEIGFLDTTLLTVACQNEDKDTIEVLIRHGENINSPGQDDTTALMTLCIRGNVELIDFIAEHGANINQAVDNGDTALIVACEYGKIEAIKYLIEHGADINHQNSDGETPLTIACSNRNEKEYLYEDKIKMVKYLVENGADINHLDNAGNSPLIYACTNEYERIVEYLVINGANVNQMDKYNKIPLNIAIEKRNIRIINILINHRINNKRYCDVTDINDLNPSKITRLMY